MGTGAFDDSARDGRGGRLELPYLDGIRGVAALAVVAYHAFLFTGRDGQSRTELPLIDLVVGWGYLGVPVFIVLSGYVLMLPLLRTEDLTFPGGTKAFLLRRSRRILPPYYAALTASLLLIALVPILQQPRSTQWDSKIPVTVPDVITHLLLVHDFSAASIGKINGPLWSVAVEWQIYFLMPLLLVPLWRRFNPYAIVVALTAVASAAAIVLRVLPTAHPWFVALFAMGMLAAQVTVTARVSRRQVWLGTAGTAAVILVAQVFSSDPNGDRSWAYEILVGGTVAAALAWTGRRALAGRTGVVRSLLQTKPFLFAGTISYSVYLMHSPLLGLANLLLLPAQLPIGLHWALMTFGAAPIAIGLSYGLFLLVERRFLNTHQRRVQKELLGGGGSTEARLNPTRSVTNPMTDARPVD